LLAGSGALFREQDPAPWVLSAYGENFHLPNGQAGALQLTILSTFGRAGPCPAQPTALRAQICKRTAKVTSENRESLSSARPGVGKPLAAQPCRLRAQTALMGVSVEGATCAPPGGVEAVRYVRDNRIAKPCGPSRGRLGYTAGMAPRHGLRDTRPRTLVLRPSEAYLSRGACGTQTWTPGHKTANTYFMHVK